MKKRILFALLFFVSTAATACPDGKSLSWQYSIDWTPWIVGFAFYVDGIQVGTAPATARSATCAEVGITGTTGRITMKAIRDDQISVDSNNLDFNLDPPGIFNLNALP